MPQSIHVTLSDGEEQDYEIADTTREQDEAVYDVPDWAREENIHALGAKFPETKINALEDLFAYDSYTTIEEFEDGGWERLVGAPALLFSVGMTVQFVPASEEFDYSESQHFMANRFYENSWDVRSGVITLVYPDHDTLQVVSGGEFWYLKCEV